MRKRIIALFFLLITIFSASCSSEEKINYNISDSEKTEFINEKDELPQTGKKEISNIDVSMSDILTGYAWVQRAGFGAYKPYRALAEKYISIHFFNKIERITELISLNIDIFLDYSKASGYGMRTGNKSATQLTFIVEDKKWTIFNSNIEAFDSADMINMEWTGHGVGTCEDSKVNVTAETYMAIDFANLFPEINNAYINTWVEDGKCKAVYYAPESKHAVMEIESLFGEGGWTVENYEWNGTIAGFTASGQIVGTFPLLEIE